MIEQLLSFVAVVRCGGYSAAAKKEGRSKALLSRHVSQLERYIGQPLLYRSTRAFSLTEIGETLYYQGTNIEENYHQAIDNAKRDDTVLKGKLRITTTISLGGELLPMIIHNFKQRYPDLDIVCNLSSETVDLVAQGYDLSLRAAHVLPDTNLRMRKLCRFEMVLCASPDYLTTRVTLNSIRDLKEHQCVTSINRHPEKQTVTWSFVENNQPISPYLEIDSIQAQLALVRLGSGIGRLPKIFAEDDLASGRLVQVLPGCAIPPIHLFALYPNLPMVPAKTHSFIDFICQQNLAG